MALHEHIRVIAQALNQISHALKAISDDLAPQPDPNDEAARIARCRAISIHELELSVRLVNCLTNANLHTLGDIADCTEKWLRAMPNFGTRSLNELRDVMQNYGLFFKGNDIT